MRLAELRMQLGDPDGAIEAYELATASDPNALCRLADLYASQGNFVRELDVLQRLSEAAPAASTYLRMARIAKDNLLDEPQALSLCELALAIWPEDPEIPAQVDAMLEHEEAVSLEVLEKRCDVLRSLLDIEPTADRFIRLGDLLAALEDLEGAAEAWKQAAAANVDALFRLADLYNQLGAFDAEMKALERATARRPTEEGYLRMAYLAEEELLDQAQAADLFRAAHLVNPDSAEAREGIDRVDENRQEEGKRTRDQEGLRRRKPVRRRDAEDESLDETVRILEANHVLLNERLLHQDEYRRSGAVQTERNEAERRRQPKRQRHRPDPGERTREREAEGAGRRPNTELKAEPPWATKLGPAAPARPNELPAPPTKHPRQDWFVAWPNIDAQKRVESDGPFYFMVGYRGEPSDETTTGGPVAIREIGEEQRLLVSVYAKGGQVKGRVTENGLEAGRTTARLSLDLSAVATFQCTPFDGAPSVELTATYFLDGEVVGYASRTVGIGRETDPEPPLPTAPKLGTRLAQAKVDLVVAVQLDRTTQRLHWTWVSEVLGREEVQEHAKVREPAKFLRRLQQHLSHSKFGGQGAANTLDTIGAEVGDLIPEGVWTSISELGSNLGRRPTLLWLTDEPLIPWELALPPSAIEADLTPLAISKTAGVRLGTTTVMARWILHKGVEMPPPVEVEIFKISAIASRYGREVGIPSLPHAIPEAEEILGTYYPASTYIQARRANVLAFSQGATPFVGHLVHFAIHGISNPKQAGEDYLLLEDGKLPSSALTHRRRAGEPPVFTFVFLNGCQIGATQQALGQASGFAPTLLRAGTAGFVAPIWDIHGQAAKQAAVRFYELVLGKQRSVGEALLSVRGGYVPGGSTTSMAYVYYGHPCTQMRLENSL